MIYNKCTATRLWSCTHRNKKTERLCVPEYRNIYKDPKEPIFDTYIGCGEYYDSMNTYGYDRAAAVEYARKWALKRNPAFYDFNDIGGDCTNFASQCIYAGCGVMNHTPIYGWFYISTVKRTPSWAGVEFLHNFLISNRGDGPFAEIVDPLLAEPGDVIQLCDETGRFYHSPVVVSIPQSGAKSLDEILIAAHTYDTLDRPISTYNAIGLRAIHILGYRK